MTVHQPTVQPFPVDHPEQGRLGHVAVCSCGYGVFVIGRDAKEACWAEMAAHIVRSTPELAMAAMRRFVEPGPGGGAT